MTSAAERRKAGKRPRRPAVVLEIEIRHPAIALRALASADDHDAIGIVERQAANQDGVDEREHRRVDADAQRQRDDGDGGEPAVLHEQPDREPNVLPEVHRHLHGQAGTAPTSPVATPVCDYGAKA